MLNDLECPAIPELANECKDALRQFKSGDLSLQFDIELCEISCRNKDCIADFRWRPEPTAPNEYTNYLGKVPKDRAIYLDQHPTFLTQGKIAVYLDARDMVKALNKRNLSALLGWLKLSISPAAHLSVEKYVNTYSGRMS